MLSSSFYTYHDLLRGLVTVPSSVSGPTAWNSLPNHVKNAPSLETFKAQLKIYLFKQS